MSNRRTVLFLRDIPWDPEGRELTTARTILQDEGVDPVFLGKEQEGMPIPPTILRDITPDIVLVDYGGMAMAGAHDGARSNVRYILQWADDHPSTAIIVWTQFTQFLADELYDAFGHSAPANVFIYQKGREEGWDAIRLYLGISLWTASNG